jgi:hypothetical protein
MTRPRKPPPPPPKRRDFGAVVRELLIERGMTTAIGNPNWMDFALSLPTVSYESLRKAVTGDRPPGQKIMEEVAAALDVEPSVFWEWSLAQAQHAFDPQHVGEDEAFANLQAWLKVTSTKPEEMVEKIVTPAPAQNAKRK